MEELKKFLFLLVALMLVLVGCTTTNPSLKDTWLNAVNQTSSESKLTLSADVNIDGMNLTNEQKKIAELFEAGFVIEQKAQDEHNAYVKITANNDKPLRDLGVWTAKEKATAEILVKENVMYFKTSADPFFFKVDMDEMDGQDFNMQSQYEMQQKVMEFMKGEFKNYISQFNYEIPKLQDLGFKTIQTPEGKEEVLKVKFELGINEILDFIVYTMDNLANYERLDIFVKEFAGFMPAEVQPTEAELTTAVTEAKTQLGQFKAMLSGMNEESLEAMIGKDIDFKITTEYGISKEKYIASEDTIINIGIKDPTTGENGSAVIKATSLVWNVNGDVKLPEVKDAVNVTEYENDINKVRTLPDDTPLKKLLLQKFNASFTIGEPYAILGSDFKELDAAPYIKDGSTMVPVAVIGEWLDSETKWDGNTNQVTLKVKDTEIKLTLGSKEAYVNGNKVIMHTAAESVNGRTFVPVAFIAKELGAKSEYNSETQEVKIYFE
ncbi:copper amine oxidase N-terminal domain-containing protein [Schinkia azotoformans]|uniref:Anion ABC transporter anion-binding protein n=1 Tax=Schinkia azotoformans LMG 9581 TaxID=1131731 RepID=K6DJT4_SCHAZ|nr:copper amine oxidase N-terminal domain-containing protein [Schinkia azotoformans]EKN68554.1 anion ABC transporter anion-binding protein [Schinkia azotoformans LMG 9581]MEC1637579.1 copper amine oxidase N-terminal domain-containing protein [Schinkia azotoformans]MEC1943983.1 copper amine oxidase N-terminal domain-containing protein [Schinkia azotoformans]